MPGPDVLLACDWFVKYTAGLAAGLADAGAGVTLLTRDHDREFGDRPGASSAFVAAATGGRVPNPRLGGRAGDPRTWPAARRLRRTLAAARPDVVHVQETIGTDQRLVAAAGLRRGRFAITVHDPVPHPGDRPTPKQTVILRAMLRAAGLVFVHSEALRNELDGLGWTRAPVEVVPHGVDAPIVTTPPDRPALLFFGRVGVRYKGLDVLLDALPAIWARQPQTTLTIAGAGALEPHPLHADPRVTVRNEHVADDELPALFGAASVCVLPYRQASQSGVGSQAKAYARPMVVTATGGLPELVADGSGLVASPGDPAPLAEAVLELLADPARAAAMGRAGAASVAAVSGWPAVGRATLDAYRRHLGV